MPRRKNPPALVHHRPTGQGRIRVDGKDTYLGVYGTPECRDAYEAKLREWRLAQADDANLTVDILAIRYLDFADGYYRRKDGSPTGEANNVREALRPLVRLKGAKLDGA